VKFILSISSKRQFGLIAAKGTFKKLLHGSAGFFVRMRSTLAQMKREINIPKARSA
jgi:hypothetical protein